MKRYHEDRLAKAWDGYVAAWLEQGKDIKAMGDHRIEQLKKALFFFLEAEAEYNLVGPFGTCQPFFNKAEVARRAQETLSRAKALLDWEEGFGELSQVCVGYKTQEQRDEAIVSHLTTKRYEADGKRMHRLAELLGVRIVSEQDELYAWWDYHFTIFGRVVEDTGSFVTMADA